MSDIATSAIVATMSPTLSATRVATLVGDFPRSPAYVGLADSLRVLIGDGRIGLGVRLPSERELTAALDVSRTTVTRAYEALRESGYAEARRGSGTFTRVPGGRRRAHDRSLLPGTGGEDVIDLNCAAHSAPPGLAEAYQRATEELPAYLVLGAAGGHAVCSAAVADNPQLAEQYAAAAIRLLQRAFEKNYNAIARDAARDKNLDALRARADFQKLVSEWEAKQKQPASSP